jgi:hypothetical protein
MMEQTPQGLTFITSSLLLPWVSLAVIKSFSTIYFALTANFFHFDKQFQ